MSFLNIVRLVWNFLKRTWKFILILVFIIVTVVTVSSRCSRPTTVRYIGTVDNYDSAIQYHMNKGRYERNPN